MIETSRCPECEAFDTDRVHVEWFSDRVEEVRICNECPTQFTVEYVDPRKQVDSTAEP